MPRKKKAPELYVDDNSDTYPLYRFRWIENYGSPLFSVEPFPCPGWKAHSGGVPGVLDIFRPCAVVADEVCDSHLPERRFENSPHLSPGGRFESSPPFQGWDYVANTQSPEGTVEPFSGDPLS